MMQEYLKIKDQLAVMFTRPLRDIKFIEMCKKIRAMTMKVSHQGGE